MKKKLVYVKNEFKNVSSKSKDELNSSKWNKRSGANPYNKKKTKK